MKKSTATPIKLAIVGFHVVLIAYALVVLYPVLIMLFSSIKSTRELYTNPDGFPAQPMWSV